VPKNNLYSEQDITVAAGKTYIMDFFPFKVQLIEVFNLGANDAKAMVNDQSIANGITVFAGGMRTFSSSGPVLMRINFYSLGGTTLKVVATR